jgi:hypothetical protein
MTTGLNAVALTWFRCVDGYRFTRGKSCIVAKSHQREEYQPLRVQTENARTKNGGASALFAQFADSNADAEGMLSFCNKFGLPFGRGGSYAGPGGSVVRFATEVSVQQLLTQHAEMQRAFRLFEKGDPTALTQYCNWQAGLRMDLRRRSDGSLQFSLAPPDLLSGMWYQFVEHACSGARLFRCEQCQHPFRVGPGTGRRNTSRYCSKSCGMAAWQASSGK